MTILNDECAGLYAEILQRRGGGGGTCPKAERNLSLCRLLKGKCPCLTQQLGGNLVFKKRRGEGGGGLRQGEHWKTMWSPTVHKTKFKASS